ncbi:MAG: hypothetical protein JWQ77_3739 [Jatrophihabitans sp.]|nr:hypothetical protein [Jatrophihabitans sp.]
MASALAAILATVAASYLGVAGTVIGAAVASVLTVLGNAVFGHSIRRTGDRVRTAIPAATRWVPPPAQPPLIQPPAEPAAEQSSARAGGTWRVFAAAAVGVFVGVLLVVTGVEAIAGRPLTDLLRGKSGSGTTVFGTTPKHKASPTPTPTVTVTVTPTVVVITPTVTITGAATTATRTPTVTITPSPTESTTPTPSATTSTPSIPASPTP